MRLQYGFLADAAEIGADGKISVTGIFDRIRVVTFREGIITLPVFCLVLHFGCHATEGSEHQLRVECTGPEGDHVAEGNCTLKLKPLGAQLPWQGEAILWMRDLPIAQYGAYRFDLSVDGQARGHLNLYIYREVGDIAEVDGPSG